MNVDVRSTLKKFNLHPTKSLGQNFLNDTGILKRIVEAAGLSKGDLVLEIGPGLGSLTVRLADKAGLVVAVEIDKKLIPALNANIQDYLNIKIIQDDILKLDVDKVLKEAIAEREGEFSHTSTKIVANLPYYITTPVVMKLLEGGLTVETMVFMVQKEVADRMIAKPGGKDYGALSVAVQYYSNASIAIKVPPSSFIPQPDVDSCVVKLDIYKTPPVKLHDKKLFFRVVKAAFGQRRKTLVNALNNSGFFNLTKDEIKKIFDENGFDENLRGETLSIGEFARLSNSIYEKGR